MISINNDLYLKAIKLAVWRHSLNRYDGKPYYVHFEEVESILVEHGETSLISKIEAWLHDIIEDGGMTYNDIKKEFGIEVAEVVYLCTDNKGRNRKERKNSHFYDEMKQSPFKFEAIKIKVADRIANMRKSKKTQHSMNKLYIDEYTHFKQQLYIEGHISSMWEELDSLISI